MDVALIHQKSKNPWQHQYNTTHNLSQSTICRHNYCSLRRNIWYVLYSVIFLVLIQWTAQGTQLKYEVTQNDYHIWETVSNKWLSGETGALRISASQKMNRQPIILADISSNKMLTTCIDNCRLFSANVISLDKHRAKEIALIVFDGHKCTIIESDDDAIKYLNSIHLNNNKILDGITKSFCFAELRQYQLATSETFAAIKTGISSNTLREFKIMSPPPKLDKNSNEPVDAKIESNSNRMEEYSIALCMDKDKLHVKVVYITFSYGLFEKWTCYRLVFDKESALEIEGVDNLGTAGGSL